MLSDPSPPCRSAAGTGTTFRYINYLTVLALVPTLSEANRQKKRGVWPRTHKHAPSARMTGVEKQRLLGGGSRAPTAHSPPACLLNYGPALSAGDWLRGGGLNFTASAVIHRQHGSYGIDNNGFPDGLGTPDLGLSFCSVRSVCRRCLCLWLQRRETGEYAHLSYSFRSQISHTGDVPPLHS